MGFAIEIAKVFCYSNYIAKNTVIPAWMLESSHKDVKQFYKKLLIIIMRLPSVALDSGIHARMTGLIVQYLKTNILPGLINAFSVSGALERDKECRIERVKTNSVLLLDTQAR
jgi:hypothetical protein